METLRTQSRFSGPAGRGPEPQHPAAPHAVPPLPAPGAGPLHEDDFRLIATAIACFKAIRSAARTAWLSAATTLTIGIFSALFFVVWPSWEGAFVAVGLCAIGAVEYWGYCRMRRAEVGAAGLLAKNQLAFLGLIVVYCLAQMLMFSTQKIKAEALSPEVRAQMAALPSMERAIDGQIDHYAPLVTYGFYGLVIVLSLLFQGGLALYYFSRKKRLVEFHRQTPDWVRRVVLGSSA